MYISLTNVKKVIKKFGVQHPTFRLKMFLLSLSVLLPPFSCATLYKLLIYSSFAIKERVKKRTTKRIAVVGTFTYDSS